ADRPARLGRADSHLAGRERAAVRLRPPRALGLGFPLREAEVEFDSYTIVLLTLRPDAPELDDEAAAAVQDAHMAHIAELHEAGYLLAAGPLSDEKFRGLSILNVDPERARELKEQDPAVQIGRLAVKVIPWIVPVGAISFSRIRFPRSVAEAES